MTRKAIFFIFLFFILTVLISCNNKRVKIADKYSDGGKRIVLSYPISNDTLTYLYEFFYNNGKLGSKGNFVNGKQNGLWKWWFENGNEKDEATFNNGNYINKRKHWREDGTLHKVEIFNGECKTECCDGKIELYNSLGIKNFEYTISNGMYNGVGISYYSNGNKNRKFNYIDNKKNGQVIEYDTLERIIAIGNYKNDKSDGEWILYDSLMNVTKRYIDREDFHEGSCIEYYSNGQISAQGNYTANKENGKWMFYDSLGQFMGYKIYDKGKLIQIKSKS